MILLHCVVNYPPPFSELNLRAIETMRRAFRVPVGWSDHTPGWLAPVGASQLSVWCVAGGVGPIPGQDRMTQRVIDPISRPYTTTEVRHR